MRYSTSLLLSLLRCLMWQTLPHQSETIRHCIIKFIIYIYIYFKKSQIEASLAQEMSMEKFSGQPKAQVQPKLNGSKLQSTCTANAHLYSCEAEDDDAYANQSSRRFLSTASLTSTRLGQYRSERISTCSTKDFFPCSPMCLTI